MRTPALAVAATAALLPLLLRGAQVGPPPGAGADWPTYNRDLAGTRYSPLTQINTGNVARLAPAWSYTLDRASAALGLTGGSEFTPLVLGGVMYVAATGRLVALDADSGREIWRRSTGDLTPSRRGLAYWPGEASQPARIFFTAGSRLVALRAATGEPAAGFGKGGSIDMGTPRRRPSTTPSSSSAQTARPAAFARSMRARAHRSGSSRLCRSRGGMAAGPRPARAGRVGRACTAGRSRRRSTGRERRSTWSSTLPASATTGAPTGPANCRTASGTPGA